MIKVTHAAEKYLTKLLSKQKKNTHIRVFINFPGTVDAECGITYCNINTVKNTDIEIKFSKFSIFVDKSSKEYLLDSQIDIVKDNLGVQLNMKSPNAKLKAPNVNSSLFDKINYLIQSKINPQLLNHGGKITLIKIINRHVLIEFSGGCNGCSMVNLTLKEGIEKELITNFPEIKGIKDITEHQAGEHSYI